MGYHCRFHLAHSCVLCRHSMAPIAAHIVRAIKLTFHEHYIHSLMKPFCAFPYHLFAQIVKSLFPLRICFYRRYYPTPTRHLLAMAVRRMVHLCSDPHCPSELHCLHRVSVRDHQIRAFP